MTDLELIEMGIKMIKREKRLMIKKQNKALKIHDKKMSNLDDELDELMERRTAIANELSNTDKLKERDVVAER